MRTVFLRVLEADNKAAALLSAVREPDRLAGTQRFEVDPASFASVPGSPFAYQASARLRGLFKELPPFEGESRIARGSNSVDDNARYVRLWWEVDTQLLNNRWRPWSRGGAFSSFYYDLDTLVCWDDSRSTYPGFLGTPHRPLERPASVQHFFRPGLTWPLRTNGLSLRVLPTGCIFTNKGPAAFVRDDNHQEILALASIANSRAFGQLVSLQLARTELAQSYVMGLIQQTPVPELSGAHRRVLATLASRAWSLKRSLDTINETSHAFLLPQGPNERVTGLDRGAIERELDSIQREIDDRAFTLYGIGPDDCAEIEASSKRGAASDGEAEDLGQEDDDSGEDETPVSDATDTLISWLVGVAFGRFDLRLATGQRAIPPEPDPFDTLPSRSPGMWPEGEERDVRPPDILVDDPGHNDDIGAHVANVATTTGLPDPHDLRRWLACKFFPLHIKMYSKSRRKAPIYWQLGTPSGSYSVWLYIHAFSKDTLFRVQNDYAAPKLAHEERRLESLRSELRDGATATQRKALAAQESFVEELRAFLEEVKRVAPLWNPNLDDGVIINFAPLWRLVPQNKSWQRELKSTWDALCDGKYDWAHLAMHLWPERVVPKCAKDRSLAIAHGLEDVLWIEGSDGKWTARSTPTRSIDELVRERTSPAVKSALKSLLEAPSAVGAAKKAKKGKANA